MTQNVSLLALTVLAAAAIEAERFVTGTGTYAVPGGSAFGVSRSKTAIGERFSADVIGTAIVVAGEAIAHDAKIEVGADGKAVEADEGTVVARALQAATGDGDRIEVLLIAN